MDSTGSRKSITSQDGSVGDWRNRVKHFKRHNVARKGSGFLNIELGRE